MLLDPMARSKKNLRNRICLAFLIPRLYLTVQALIFSEDAGSALAEVAMRNADSIYCSEEICI